MVRFRAKVDVIHISHQSGVITRKWDFLALIHLQGHKPMPCVLCNINAKSALIWVMSITPDSHKMSFLILGCTVTYTEEKGNLVFWQVKMITCKMAFE